MKKLLFGLLMISSALFSAPKATVPLGGPNTLKAKYLMTENTNAAAPRTEEDLFAPVGGYLVTNKGNSPYIQQGEGRLIS